MRMSSSLGNARATAALARASVDSTSESAASRTTSTAVQCSRCPTQRNWIRGVSTIPGTDAKAASAVASRSGSMPSMSLRPMLRMVPMSRTMMAAEISRPTMGSASGKPSIAPPAPSTTAREVNPSVRACTPSATSAAEPIRRPILIRYIATASLPMNPTMPAASTQPRCARGCGWISRSTDCQAASTADSATTSTMNNPARSSARP